MQLSVSDARERGGGHCAGSQWGHDGFWPAGWRFVDGSSQTMYVCTARFDSITSLNPHPLALRRISQYPVAFTGQSSSYRPGTTLRPDRQHSSTPLRPAPASPTTPHGPASPQHQSSTPCRPDWPNDATWTRITSAPIQHPLSPRLAPRRHMDPHHLSTNPAPPCAPTGPTTPHGPESPQHQSSTPCRPDQPNDATWTRITSAPIQHPL